MILDLLVSALLLTSGTIVLTSALGITRLPDFFLRMHAPAIAYSGASWAVSLASVLHFSTGAQEVALHSWLIIILLAITAPVTTVLLARAALFRGRQAGEPLPRPFGTRKGDGDHTD